MAGCKHYSDITNQHLKNLEDLLETEFAYWNDDELDSSEAIDELELSLVYDPLKKVLKVRFKEKRNGLRAARVWKILDELLTFSRSTY